MVSLNFQFILEKFFQFKPKNLYMQSLDLLFGNKVKVYKDTFLPNSEVLRGFNGFGVNKIEALTSPSKDCLSSLR